MNKIFVTGFNTFYSDDGICVFNNIGIKGAPNDKQKEEIQKTLSKLRKEIEKLNKKLDKLS